MHTCLEGHRTKWSAAYTLLWCEEYARLPSRAPEFLKMLTTYKPVASTLNSFKHASSVSMLRHWPEYPSYYLTGDLETARQTSVPTSPLMENRIAPVFEDASDSVPETGPGHAEASSSSGSGYRAGEVFLEEEEPGDAAGSGTGMTEAQVSAEKQEEYLEYLNFLVKLRTPATKLEYKQNTDGSRE